jgi:hypothetical protein
MTTDKLKAIFYSDKMLYVKNLCLHSIEPVCLKNLHLPPNLSKIILRGPINCNFPFTVKKLVFGWYGAGLIFPAFLEKLDIKTYCNKLVSILPPTLKILFVIHCCSACKHYCRGKPIVLPQQITNFKFSSRTFPSTLIAAMEKLHLDRLTIVDLYQDFTNIRTKELHVRNIYTVPQHLKLPSDLKILTVGSSKFWRRPYCFDEFIYKINGTNTIINSLRVLKIDIFYENSYLDLSASKIEILTTTTKCQIKYPSTLKKLFIKYLPTNLKMQTLFPINFGSKLETLGVGSCFNSLHKLRKRFVKFLSKSRGRSTIKNFDVEDLASDFEPIPGIKISVITNLDLYVKQF